MLVTLVCKYCDDSYKEKHYRSERSNYCSLKCKRVAMRVPKRPRAAIMREDGSFSIPVTNSTGTVVSEEDRGLEAYRWYVNRVGSYPHSRKDGGTIFIHREVLARSIGRPLKKGEYADHINHDTYDNRRGNLRLANSSQSIANRRCLSTKGSSRYKGVSFDKKRGRWCGRIAYGPMRVRLGYFDTEDEAANVYDQWALQLHGEFAYLNFEYS